MKLDRLHIELDVFREPWDHKNVLVCFSEDYRTEQRHLLQSTAVPVSVITIKESLNRIISQILDGSVYANSPGEAETVSQSESAQS